MNYRFTEELKRVSTSPLDIKKIVKLRNTTDGISDLLYTEAPGNTFHRPSAKAKAPACHHHTRLQCLLCLESVSHLCALTLYCEGKESGKCSSRTSSPWDTGNSIRERTNSSGHILSLEIF